MRPPSTYSRQAPAAQTAFAPAPGAMPQMARPIPQMPPTGPSRKGSSVVTLKTPVFVLMIIAIVVALVVGFISGAMTIYGNLADQITSAQDQITSTQKQLSSAQDDASNWKKAYEDLQTQDSSDADSSDSTGSSESSGSGSSSDSTASGNSTKAKGETETNGTLDMTFNSMEEIASVPQQWNGTQPDLTPAEGTRFISVKVHIVNNGKEPVDLTCGYVVDIRAVNSSDQQYTPIDNLFKIPGNPECNAELQPGLGADMQYVFNVPKDAKMVGFGWRDVTDFSVHNDYSTFRF